ncbi:hypothetical protein AB0F81_10145 [Actinoplanes sp. NPDC024001]|uniref:hypothetical protein n=1 Tax=Actinoplanes sp. NPDC024001 TaxID=3154598 RepID=UPI0033DBBFDC
MAKGEDRYDARLAQQFAFPDGVVGGLGGNPEPSGLSAVEVRRVDDRLPLMNPADGESAAPAKTSRAAPSTGQASASA